MRKAEIIVAEQAWKAIVSLGSLSGAVDSVIKPSQYRYQTLDRFIRFIYSHVILKHLLVWIGSLTTITLNH